MAASVPGAAQTTELPAFQFLGPNGRPADMPQPLGLRGPAHRVLQARLRALPRSARSPTAKHHAQDLILRTQCIQQFRPSADHKP
jgi:hypothetical protein